MLGGLAADTAVTQQTPDGFIQRQHPLASAGEDVVVDRFDLAKPNRGGDRASVEHDLQGQHAFVAFADAGQQVLTDHGPQAERQLGPDFALDIWREQVGIARDRSFGVAGVQGGKDQVPVSAALSAICAVS